MVYVWMIYRPWDSVIYYQYRPCISNIYIVQKCIGDSFSSFLVIPIRYYVYKIYLSSLLVILTSSYHNINLIVLYQKILFVIIDISWITMVHLIFILSQTYIGVYFTYDSYLTVLCFILIQQWRSPHVLLILCLLFPQECLIYFSQSLDIYSCKYNPVSLYFSTFLQKNILL